MIYEATIVILGRAVIERGRDVREVPGLERLPRDLGVFVDGGLGHSYVGVEILVPARVVDFPAWAPVALSPDRLGKPVGEDAAWLAVDACHALPGGSPGEPPPCKAYLTEYGLWAVSRVLSI